MAARPITARDSGEMALSSSILPGTGGQGGGQVSTPATGLLGGCWKMAGGGRRGEREDGGGGSR